MISTGQSFRVSYTMNSAIRLTLKRLVMLMKLMNGQWKGLRKRGIKIELTQPYIKMTVDIHKKTVRMNDDLCSDSKKSKTELPVGFSKHCVTLVDPNSCATEILCLQLDCSSETVTQKNPRD